MRRLAWLLALALAATPAAADVVNPFPTTLTGDVTGTGVLSVPATIQKTGNTSKFATSTGTLTSGDCVKIDASGNYVDAGAACASGGATPTLYQSFTTTQTNVALPTSGGA